MGDGYHERQSAALAGFRLAGGNATFTYENPPQRRSTWAGPRLLHPGDLTSQGGDFRSTQCHPVILSSRASPTRSRPVASRRANAASLVACPQTSATTKLSGTCCLRKHRDSFAMTAEQSFGDYRLFADVIASKREYAIRPRPSPVNLTVPSTNPSTCVRPPRRRRHVGDGHLLLHQRCAAEHRDRQVQDPGSYGRPEVPLWGDSCGFLAS